MKTSSGIFRTGRSLIKVGRTRASRWRDLELNDWAQIDDCVERRDFEESVLSFEDADGDTILIACIKKGYIDIFVNLIDAGADVNYIARSGLPVLDIAMLYADESDDYSEDFCDGGYAPWTVSSSHFVIELLAAGADPRSCADWSRYGVGTYQFDCIADEVRGWLDELRPIRNSNAVLVKLGPGDLVASFLYREQTLRSAIAAA